MMAYDDVTQEFIVLQSATINDFPEFRHRGILVDTSRNFVSVDVLKRIIDAMALSKVKSCSSFFPFKSWFSKQLDQS